MPEKIYKCKKCSEEFQDLSEYRAHILHCKGEAEETVEPEAEETVEPEAEETVEPEEATEVDTVKKLTAEQAKRINTCRGNFEGNKSEICKKYDKCSQCWNDFRG